MRKYLFTFAAILFIVTYIHAQPQRIGKTDVYFELIVEGGDTTIRFTGKGQLEYNSKWTKYRKNIKHVVIEDGITETCINAFSNCKNLTTVSLPQSLKIIGNNSFQQCENILQINLPYSLESIGSTAFYFTGGLPDSICLPNLYYIGKRTSETFIEGSTFSYTSIKHVTIPYKIDTLFTNFSNCYKLSSAVIPATVKNFTGGTFYNDTALKLVINLSPLPQTFEVPKGHYNAFYRVKRSQCRLIVPSSAVGLYKSTPVWEDFLIEGGGLSAGVTINDKTKGNIEGVEYRLYQSGENVTWTASPKKGCTFTGWRSNGEWLSTSPTLSFTITQDTLIEAVFEGEVSVPETDKKAEKVLLYPNPAHTQFTVQANSPIRSITVFDLSGRKVLETNNHTVNVSEIAKGIYMVEIQTAEGRHMKKFIRQ